MKKIFFIMVAILSLSSMVFADDKADVLATFDKYVNDANSYSEDIPKYYTNNAKIVRVVNKKQGGQKAVIIPFDRYLSELKTHSKIAKITNYKNTYVDRKVVQIGDNYKVSATRIPRNDKTGLSSYFVFAKVGNEWKIKEESMTTNVQTFLNAD